MSPNGRNHYEDWDLFALGALDEQEQRDMAAHLASGCDECAQAYRDAEATVAGLATLSPEEPLPAGAEMRMKKRLEADAAWTLGLRQMTPIKTPSKILRIAPWALAAACALIAILMSNGIRHMRHEVLELERQNAEFIFHIQHETQGASNVAAAITPEQVTELHNTIDGLQRDLKVAQAAQSAALIADQQLKSAQAELAAAKSQLAESQTRVQQLDVSLKEAESRRAKAEEELSAAHLQLAKAQAGAEQLTQVSAQNDQIVRLLEAAPLSQLDLKPASGVQASARVFWHDDHGLLLVARGLPRLPEHGSFQLWFYRKGTPEFVNVGVVQLGTSGNGVLFVPPGPALVSMTGALLTEESGNGSTSTPGEEILKIKP